MAQENSIHTKLLTHSSACHPRSNALQCDVMQIALWSSGLREDPSSEY